MGLRIDNGGDDDDDDDDDEDDDDGRMSDVCQKKKLTSKQVVAFNYKAILQNKKRNPSSWPTLL